MSYRVSIPGAATMVHTDNNRRDAEIATRDLALRVIVGAGYNLDASYSSTDATAIGMRSNAYLVAFARPLAKGADHDCLDAAYKRLDGSSAVVATPNATPSTPARSASAPGEHAEDRARREMIARSAAAYLEPAPTDDSEEL